MVDAVSTQVFDMAVTADAGTSMSPQQTQVFDVANFEAGMNPQQASPEQVAPVESGSESGFKAAIRVLDSLNGEVAAIGGDARSILSNTDQMTPGAMIELTMKAHHFLFQSELTANIANKTSEGVQQLFRQQS
ncbi:hypothetical protein [Hahella ganghwensis]|uniref:hypothetical protein n=1 Tax=Hahella ganghwensis TaxID=286420 RepID=UPI00037A8729|nr:hypothetical protein [Hahella ganghwensis]